MNRIKNASVLVGHAGCDSIQIEWVLYLVAMLTKELHCHIHAVVPVQQSDQRRRCNDANSIHTAP